MSIEIRVAVGVGEKFAILNGSRIGHISLQNTHTLVEVDGEIYNLYKGRTFEDSRKVDDYFDMNPVIELNIKDHLATAERVYDVTITRFGCAKVTAKSPDEAMMKANALPESSITWNEDWEATDAVAEE